MTLRDDRINYWVFLGDSFGFRLGMSIVSLTTIMPLLLATLGASNFVIGLLPALASLGESLPGTFAASRIQNWPLKKPWLLRTGAMERVFLLSNAVGLMLFARERPAVAVAWLLTAWTLCTGSSGLSIPSYHSMLAKCIRPENRGGMIGTAGAAQGLVGVAAAQAAGVVLTKLPFPANYAMLFVAAFIITTASFVPFVWAREPADDVGPVGCGGGGRVGGNGSNGGNGGNGGPASDARGRSEARLWSFGSRAMHTVRGNTGYMRAVAALAVMAFGLMATSFYSTYAVRELGAGSIEVARFTSIAVGVGVVCFPAFGRVADCYGHKRSLELAALSFAGAAGAALLMPSLAGVYIALVLGGAGISGQLVSQNVIWSEFSPTHADVPLYISASMLLMMPFRALAPALAGWLADMWGFRVMFAAALAAGVASFTILKLAVPEPRRIASKC